MPQSGLECQIRSTSTLLEFPNGAVLTESTFHIGNAAGFALDRFDAGLPVARALAAAGRPAALFYETLAERTLASAQLDRLADPEGGYTPDLDRFLEPVLGLCVSSGVPILGNFGAANPRGAARAVHRLARRLGLRPLRVAVVEGDDLRDQLARLQVQAWEGEALVDRAAENIIAANAYLGAEPIVEALALGPDVVVTGRVTDSALALAPLMHRFGWDPSDWDRIAAGVLAGHLLECGAQVTGGYFADPGYKDVPGMADIGYPVAEVTADGAITVTKPPGTGGRVDTQVVKEQLLYEIHDPSAYLTPDVTLDLRGVSVVQAGPDRVTVTGARGRPPPATVKVTVSFPKDWLGEGEISYAGPNAKARARLAAETAKERIGRLFPDMPVRCDLIGVVSVFDGDSGALSLEDGHDDHEDVRLRIAVTAPDEESARLAAREVESLYCAGPAGGAGVRRRVSRRIGSASCLVPSEAVRARAVLVEAGDA